jgi:hypothetical protein
MLGSPTVLPSRQVATPSSDRLSDSRRKEDAELRPYVVVSDIGKGSFAIVYKGYHEVRSPLTIPRLAGLPYLRKHTNKSLSKPSSGVN